MGKKKWVLFAKNIYLPAEPLCYRAAEFAFEFYVVISMLRTVFDWYLAAIRADQFFWIEFSFVFF